MHVKVEIEIDYKSMNQSTNESMEDSEFRRLIAFLQYLHNFAIKETGETQVFDIHFKNIVKL